MPSAGAFVPFAGGPCGAVARGCGPVALDPDVLAAAPVPVSTDPVVAGSGGTASDLDSGRWRGFLDDDDLGRWPRGRVDDGDAAASAVAPASCGGEQGATHSDHDCVPCPVRHRDSPFQRGGRPTFTRGQSNDCANSSADGARVKGIRWIGRNLRRFGHFAWRVGRGDELAEGEAAGGGVGIFYTRCGDNPRQRIARAWEPLL